MRSYDSGRPPSAALTAVAHDPLLMSALDVAQTLTPADRWSLLLPEAGGELRVIWHIGLAPEIADSVRIAAGAGIAGEAALSGRPVLVRDSPQARANRAAGRYRSLAYLCVPVPVQGIGNGVLCLTEWQRGALGPGSLALMERQARHLGRCVETLLEVRRSRQRVCIDRLSGLPNRWFFWTQLVAESERAVRGRYPLVLVLVRLAGVNGLVDRFGHDTGDQVLRVVGRACRTVLRRYDVACLYGDTELALLLPHAGATAARLIVDRLQLSIDQSWGQLHGGAGPQLQAGIAELDHRAPSPEALLVAAAEALDAASVRPGTSGLDLVAARRDNTPWPLERLADDLDARTTDRLDLPVDRRLVELVPLATQRYYRCVPIALAGDQLTLAIDLTSPPDAVGEIARLTGRRVLPVLCHVEVITRALERLSFLVMQRDDRNLRRETDED